MAQLSFTVALPLSSHARPPRKPFDTKNQSLLLLQHPPCKYSASLASPPSPSPPSPFRNRKPPSKPSTNPPSNLPKPPLKKPTSHPTTTTITWTKVEHLLQTLHTNLLHHLHHHPEDRPEIILAITRGGTIPAAMLSQRLETRNLVSATVLFYRDDGAVFYGLREPRFLNFPNTSVLEGRNVLIIDDVWDTGRTARAVRDRTNRAGARNVVVGCLHWKPKSNARGGSSGSGGGGGGRNNKERNDGPTVWGEVTDRWIVYPWEMMAPNGIGKKYGCE